ncbi:hypothetical protein Pogu_1739 [Pyrobaculum oguniense TE7]|uniref:Uncharacterized protein n=1 Tax=Pyrobaculum oguniense (strain DSM 13380 / JCM 10595 / TE7) TaxID=698757 RepID=H6QCF2_PYROT|nr:hypothetical protein Pogu_1739 [Pyrobaculum oguniense TE7]
MGNGFIGALEAVGMRYLSALVFPVFLLVMAATFFLFSGSGPNVVSPVQPEASGPQPPLFEGALQGQRVIELPLKAGQRLVIRVLSDRPISVYIYSSLEYEKMLKGSRATADQEYGNVYEVEAAVPALLDETFYMVIKSDESAAVSVTATMGTVDQATNVLRSGGNITRAKAMAQVDGPYVVRIPLFSPGTALRIRAEGEGIVAVLWSKEYRSFREGGSLEKFCRPDNCIRGGGSIELMSDSSDPAYIVASGKMKLTYELVATPELLIKVGTCG